MEEWMAFWLEDAQGEEIPNTKVWVKARRSGEDMFSYVWEHDKVVIPHQGRIYAATVRWKPQSLPIALALDHWKSQEIGEYDTVEVLSPSGITIHA